jgi:hypothetical protein
VSAGDCDLRGHLFRQCPGADKAPAECLIVHLLLPRSSFLYFPPKASWFWFGLARFPMIGKRCSSAARDISISSSASLEWVHPTVTISHGRIVFLLKFSPTYGVHRPAAIGLIVITGFFAL